MKAKWMLVVAFAIAMGYGKLKATECENEFLAYQTALNDIYNEEPQVYVDLNL